MNLRLLRGLAGATTLALLATAMLSSGALAANQRDVYFGSPLAEGGSGGDVDPETGALIPGHLVTNALTAGGKTATTVRIENEGGQTLNHVRFAGGAAADGKEYNLLFPEPPTTSLPTDATFAALILLAGEAACDPDTALSFECDLGTLAPGDFVEFLVVVQAPNPGLNPFWLTASWNEGWSSTGNNADYQFAAANLNVAAESCAGGTASYFLGHEPVILGDGDADGGDRCFGANADIESGAALGQDPDFANGGFASVVVDDGQAVPCPAGFRCFGSTVSVSIISGNPVPGGVEWTVTWEGTKSLRGVIHYGDNYPTDLTDFVAIQFNKASKCSTTKLTDCWISATSSPGGVKPVSITVVFVTEGNGKGGGWI